MGRSKVKTWKSEWAFGLLGLFVFVTLKMFMFPGENVAMVAALQGYYLSLSMFVTTFAGAMLGLDAWAKQIIPAQQGPGVTLPPPLPPTSAPTKVAVNAQGVRQ